GGRRHVDRRAPAPWPYEERAARTECDDGDERVVELAQLAVSVEGHAVATIAVVVEPDRSELDAVVPVERLADLVQRGVRRWRVAREPSGQARIVDHAVVH